MKQLFSIFLLFISLSAKAQYFAPLDTRSTGARSSGIIAIDSMWNLRLFDTSTAKLAFPNSLRGRVARQSGRVYYNPTGSRFVLLDSINLSGYVKYSDTATMLAPYALTSELTNQTGDAGNLQNLHITGTNGNGYLLLRHQASNPTATGSTSVVFADANGDLKWKNDNKFYTTLRDYKNTADRVYSFQDKSYTLADSAVVATKLNITDTANIRLRPIAGANMSITGTYPNLTFAAAGGGGSADSITFATNYRVDTAKTNLRTSINTKLNSTDTATMLTPYLRKVDTTAMLSGYLRKVDTASLSNRINLKANTASPTFTGTVTIPTGANITTPNILGLSSGTTNDSIVVADPSTGALKRISSSRIGGGGGGIGGSGTADFVPRFTASTTLGNGIIRDDGTNIGIGGNPYSVRVMAYGPLGVTGTTGPFSGLDQFVAPAGTSITIGNNGTSGFFKSWGITPIAMVTGIGMVVSNDGTTMTPITNAVLDVQSTNKAFYPPRMTTSQRDAMTGVAAGAMIYNTTVNKHQGWNGTTWNDMY